MSRLLVRAYLTTGILALLLATAFFFWRLQTVRDEAERAAAAAFVELSEDITALWSTAPVSRAGEQLSERLTPGQGPMVVSVYSFDTGIDYLWAEDGRYIDAVSEVRTGAPEITTNDLLHRRFSRSFELTDGSRRIITAVYPVLDGRNAYPVLRDTLIILLGIAIVAIVLALVHALARSAPAGRLQGAGSSSPQSSPVPAPAARTTATAEDGSESYGLVPVSGLEHRLSRELDRAGYHEHDLSVGMFSFSPVADDFTAVRVASTILSFFTFDDLCFDGGLKRGRQSVVVLFPQNDLQQALAQIERFQRFFWEERSMWADQTLDFFCGVSARNGRLVEAQRIIRECQAALRRAGNTPGRIMGFQPDPQRYRDFLSDGAAGASS